MLGGLGRAENEGNNEADVESGDLQDDHNINVSKKKVIK